MWYSRRLFSVPLIGCFLGSSIFLFFKPNFRIFSKVYSIIIACLLVSACGAGLVDPATTEEPSSSNINIPTTDASSVAVELGAATEEVLRSSVLSISNILVTNITENSATVNWDLNMVGTGQILFGQSPDDINNATAAEIRFVFSSHIQTISNLQQGTTYYLQIKSVSEDGDTALSNIFSVTTSEQPDYQPATDNTTDELDSDDLSISNVLTTNITETSATVSWDLNMIGTGQILFGQSPDNMNYTTDAELRLVRSSHTQTISDLQPGTLYYFRITSESENGGTALSDTFSFTTSEQSENLPVTDNTTDEISSEDLSISNVLIANITQNSATVSWDLNLPGTGQVSFGQSPDNMINTTTAEIRFIFSSHTQTISGLQPSTTYHFQIISRSENGDTALSDTFSFNTSAQSDGQGSEEPVVNVVPSAPTTPPESNDWPLSANNDIPYSGLFYGQYDTGFHTGNSRIAVTSSRRFRADRSGYIDAVSYNNRVLADENISGRCTTANPNSVWCNCQNAGLDKYSCGYTLSNSYSVGNGGSIVIQIQGNDESNGNIPDTDVLGETAIPFVPMNNESVYTPVLELETPVYLHAGEIYHLVFTNQNPPAGCSLTGNSVASASGCPRNQGAMGLNGITLLTTEGLDGGLDPFRGKSAGTLTKSNASSGWTEDPDTIAWYEIRYADGVWRGDSYAAYASTWAGKQSIGGVKIARQIFTVRDATRIVDGLWLNYGYSTGSAPTSSEISLVLKDESSNVLATGNIETSPECIAKTQSGLDAGDQIDANCRHWGYTEFTQEASLIEGNIYSIEISAPSNAQIVLSTVFELNYGPYTFDSTNRWDESHAEISTNSGSSWVDWEGVNTRLRDLSLLFTISGMPRRLP